MSRLIVLVFLAAACGQHYAGEQQPAQHELRSETRAAPALRSSPPTQAAPTQRSSPPLGPMVIPDGGAGETERGWAAFAEESLNPDDAANNAAARVLQTIDELRTTVKSTRYQPRVEVRAGDGFYGWDCSGMADWILRRAAPRARRSLKRPRPLAKHFYSAISRAPTDRARRGWQRLEHVSAARPGDLFAWLRSPLSKSKVTGHVGFLMEAPRQLEYAPGLYAARISDATSLPHQHDTRDDSGGGGFGFGTILFVTDDTGDTIAYGWFGTDSIRWGYMPANVIFGRVTR